MAMLMGGSVVDAELTAILRQQLAFRHDRGTRAVPQITGNNNPTSIVILTHNQLPYSKMCIQSVRLFTESPYELIVVDNGSTDGTPEWMRSQHDVRLIVNQENRGFAAGCNQGVAVATGDNIVLLNNDVVVTSQWLSRLEAALSSDDVGLVGPVSNSVSGPQQVPVDYRDLTGLEGFAQQRHLSCDRRTLETSRLVGFCLLIRRSVFESVGLLDERFKVGGFEDDDICRRAILAGFRCLIVNDSFVHHFRSKTFSSFGIECQAELYEAHKALYLEKWNKPAFGDLDDTPAMLKEHSARKRTTTDGQSSIGRPRISLAMIARDNADTIGACLESIRPWVDEMIVVDTGSFDCTAQIATGLGAKVFHFSWCDDFAAARNEAIRHAAGDWIFWMDSDDTIDVTNGARLRSLVDSPLDAEVMGFTVAVHCPGPRSDCEYDVTVVDHVKVFRNQPNLRFEGRIHEQILPAIRQAQGLVVWTDLFVVHSGYDHSLAGQKKKIERDLRLLRLESQERPDHPFTQFNLGMTFSNIGEHEQAIEHLKKSIEVSQPLESHLRKAYALLVYSLKESGRLDDAYYYLERGLSSFPGDLELQFRKGVLFQAMGRCQDAQRAYEGVLSSKAAIGFRSIDSGIAGFKTRFNLAIAQRECGDLSGAEAQLRLAIKEARWYLPAIRALGEILLAQGKTEDAIQFAQSLLKQVRLQCEGHMLLASIHLACLEPLEAKRQLVAAVDCAGGELEPLQRLCRLLFEEGLFDEAKLALEQLIERCPEDASARHNLGTVFLHWGSFETALGLYDESLRLRPSSVQTHLYRAFSLIGLGRVLEGRAAFIEVLRGAPDCIEARRAVEKLDAADQRQLTGCNHSDRAPQVLGPNSM